MKASTIKKLIGSIEDIDYYPECFIYHIKGENYVGTIKMASDYMPNGIIINNDIIYWLYNYTIELHIKDIFYSITINHIDHKKEYNLLNKLLKCNKSYTRIHTDINTDVNVDKDICNIIDGIAPEI